MNQLKALKILHKIAGQDGMSWEDLKTCGYTDSGLLAHAKERDQALDVVKQMIINRMLRSTRRTGG